MEIKKALERSLACFGVDHEDMATFNATMSNIRTEAEELERSLIFKRYLKRINLNRRWEWRKTAQQDASVL